MTLPPVEYFRGTGPASAAAIPRLIALMDFIFKKSCPAPHAANHLSRFTPLVEPNLYE